MSDSKPRRSARLQPPAAKRARPSSHTDVADGSSQQPDGSLLLNLPGRCQKLLADMLLEDKQQGSLLALMRSCRGLRDLVLSHCPLQLNLTFSPALTDAANIRALSTASSRALNVRVNITNQVDASAAHVRAADVFSKTHAAVQLPDGLPVTSVTLKNFTLTSFLPPWLTDICPKVTHLSFDHCKLSEQPLAATPATAAAAAKIQKLQWSVVETKSAKWTSKTKKKTFDFKLYEAEEEALVCNKKSPWRAHLAQFTGLRHLLSDHKKLITALWELCPTLDQTLVTLDCKGHGGLIMDDLLAAKLLSCKQLKRLAVQCMELELHHTDQECDWEWFSVGDVQLGALARLPLHGIRQIELRRNNTHNRGVPLTIDCGKEDCLRVAEALGPATPGRLVLHDQSARTGYYEIEHWTWKPQRRALSVMVGGDADSDALIAAVPILRHIENAKVVFFDVSATADFFRAWQQHLKDWPVMDLTFFDSDAWPEDVWPLVIPSLPTAVDLLAPGTYRRRNIALMAKHANRDTKLRLPSEVLYEGDIYKLVNDAIKQGGHKYSVDLFSYE